jgi:chaperonin GroEL
VALLRAAAGVKPEADMPQDETVGFNIVLRSCRSPLTMIAENAGKDGGIVCEKVATASGNQGYNALTDTYEDLVKAGVIDQTKVARTALANAASVATLLLTSDALIAEKPKEEKGKKGGGGHGHGGDYDMY